MPSTTPLTSCPVVAIAGATGHLGKYVLSAFLSAPFHSYFSEIIVLSRDKNPTLPKQYDDRGATLTIRTYDETNLPAALDGVNILVNTIGASGHAFKEKLLRALPQTGVQVYFPSEFGVDHYVHDFPHGEWGQKKRHYALAQELVPQVKVCRVFCGLFLEDSIGPWFGFDTRNGRYESVGSSKMPISFTGCEDVGRAVASLAAMPVMAIPEVVHVGGDSKSIADIAKIMEEAGAGEIAVTEIDLVEYKREKTAEVSNKPAAYLRFLMGENKINQTPSGLGNDNELVNHEEKTWKWKTMKDLAQATEGRPWKDFPWPPK
ncbi:isoflavone reductase family protein [Aspergillus clavatus NRRL 1]|uniref:Isoflavone reductase family protein n=1 Tax=Aspergillus clavatus (strain ATCC 1007 / CBS 513.65 / DSM 816 / NCTC 3887 / NRRL 1 / QM 1276 / 107) TaxID=344612 RepID=A1CCP6_ASPCL|nr:isoflavone reductase family protein [Aspergillus clavatus NRRL 1]EAW12303.1 isoflavone reductase family protein [Aspergillus clavatus NRRL 1]